ncbi:MAG: hypothetical protein ACI9OJ_003636, partial [Myxococcota bacterium]
MIRLGLVSLLFAPLLAVTASAESPKSLKITKVWVALSADGGPATNRELRVIAGTKVTAHVVVEARVDGRSRVFSDAKDLRKGRKRVRGVSAWPASAGRPQVALYKLEADPLKGGVYDNTGTMEHTWHPTERADHPHKWH